MSSFDFVIAAFTPPVRRLLTRAAAQESLVGAPSGTPPRTRVDGVKQIAVPMVNGVAQRSKASWRARPGSAELFVSGAAIARAILMVSYCDGVVPLAAPNILSSVTVERFGAAGC